MLRSLLDRKRHDQGAPRNFSELSILMGMLKRSGDAVEKQPDLVRPPSKRLCFKQDVVSEVPIVKAPVDVVEIPDSSGPSNESSADFEELEKILFS